MNRLGLGAAGGLRMEPVQLQKWIIGGVIVALSLLAEFLSAFPASAVEVGQEAPAFNLRSTKGGNLSLASFLGKKNVVLQFYVLDFSPG